MGVLATLLCGLIAGNVGVIVFFRSRCKNVNPTNILGDAERGGPPGAQHRDGSEPGRLAVHHLAAQAALRRHSTGGGGETFPLGNIGRTTVE